MKLSAWLPRWKVERVHACLEATGGYERTLARYLFDAGHLVSVVNPVCVKGQAQSELSRLKTDRADAALIARYCQKHRPAPWKPPAPEIEQLRVLLARLADLQGSIRRNQPPAAQRRGAAARRRSRQSAVLDGRSPDRARAPRSHRPPRSSNATANCSSQSPVLARRRRASCSC